MDQDVATVWSTSRRLFLLLCSSIPDSSSPPTVGFPIVESVGDRQSPEHPDSLLHRSSASIRSFCRLRQARGLPKHSEGERGGERAPSQGDAGRRIAKGSTKTTMSVSGVAWVVLGSLADVPSLQANDGGTDFGSLAGPHTHTRCHEAGQTRDVATTIRVSAEGWLLTDEEKKKKEWPDVQSSHRRRAIGRENSLNSEGAARLAPLGLPAGVSAGRASDLSSGLLWSGQVRQKNARGM